MKGRAVRVLAMLALAASWSCGGGKGGRGDCTPAGCTAGSGPCQLVPDGCGGFVYCGTCDFPSVDVDLPPDPAAVAPPLDATVATDLFDATSFLYTGDPPIQSLPDPAVIDPARVAVLRGSVARRDGIPLAGTRVTIVGHPEYGSTLSRPDGKYDLAVNGGAPLVVRWEREGFLPVDREVDPPRRDFLVLEDVVMTRLDPVMTSVDLLGAAEVQVARGSVVSDGDGTRSAALLFEPGTDATMVVGTALVSLSTISVRATEYTVGGAGPRAMPAPLPPSSGYTYAVELGADEAVAAGASEVRFSQPVPVYVDNFLNFPPGMIVPAGYYDRAAGRWVASDNGLVISVVSVTGGAADLDVTGDGVADADATLAPWVWCGSGSGITTRPPVGGPPGTPYCSTEGRGISTSTVSL